jgi:hypothetical protein
MLWRMAKSVVIVVACYLAIEALPSIARYLRMRKT